MTYSLSENFDQIMEVTICAVLAFTLFGSFVHGLIKGKYVIGIFGWHRATTEAKSVSFALFGLIYLAAALMFAWCLVLAFMRD